MTITADAEEPRPVWVHCGDCGHEWAPFYLPLTMDKRGIALMKSAGKACPRCVGANVFVGRKKPGGMNDDLG